MAKCYIICCSVCGRLHETSRRDTLTCSSRCRVSSHRHPEILNEVREHMFPILDEDYLSQPMDDSEARFLDEIRRWYLPEIILAYHSVLYFAGHAISRSWLVECMNLAQIVATNSTLTDAFVESGRMRELVGGVGRS